MASDQSDKIRHKLIQGLAGLEKFKAAAQAKPLRMSLIQPKLDKLLAATVNLLGNRWPRSLVHLKGSQEFFRITVNFSRHTFNSICYLVGDKTLKDDAHWYHIFALAPLNRTILDSVFNVVFILENVDERWKWYCESGYRESVEELARFKTAYPGLPGWKEWVELQSNTVDLLIADFDISTEKVANPTKTIKYWLNPGKMASQSSPANQRFLQHLNDWVYKELSSQAHLGFRGMSQIGYGVMYNTLANEVQEKLKREIFPFVRGQQVIRTVALLLCLISEVNHYFKLDLDHRLMELWILVTDHTPETKHIFELRYREIFPHFLIKGAENKS